LEILGSEPGGWTPFAGGTELMVQYGSGLLAKRRLLSIWNLPELRQIDVSGGEARIGAGCTFSEIRRSQTLAREFPLLGLAASWTGSLANQNRGTIGGNIVNASPAADSSPALLVYDAELRITSAGGARSLAYESFHLGYKRVDLRPDELLLRFELPRGEASALHYARKVGPRNAQAISKVALAAVGRIANGVVEHVRIGAASLGPTPLRCYETERFLLGRQLNTKTVYEAKAVLMSESKPIDDIRSTAEYRTQVGANLLEEFLTQLTHYYR